ncbi:adenylate/guanylate cyclase domain-containing protein [Lignipirellula cremea]|uniref:Adenylate cyclase 1 n=1 Tax=Lignipirellula cremea TaxID=2528010 RepID=A0A518DMU8_9BACT|nr:adenylate/guanylate cyclase domain-containing protein [Lignipirellula cremea]QDU93166.1 Adenylate cyclase 1 [Lignipirellula cremea]
MPQAQTVRLGRAPRNGWAVPWDLRVSRDHADIELKNDQLRVTCLERALNPCYFDGEISKDFLVAVGGEFRIGGTTFRVLSTDSELHPQPVVPETPLMEYSYRHEDAKGFDFRRADHRLDVLWNLPKIIAMSRTDEEFAQHLVGLLLDGIPRAEAAAVVQYGVGEDADNTKPLMMRLDSRNQDSTRLRPSRRLILTAQERGETILHLWSDAAAGDSKYTVSGNFDWAFSTPITDAASAGWSLYVSGRLWPEANGAEDLNGDIRFTQFIAQVVGAIRHMRQLESQQATYRQFFSPKIIRQFAGRGDINKRLEPREAQVTALFCDLRGFSQKAEDGQHDLHDLLHRCSDALGFMTEAILGHDGAIADFQGDAALGFWGWPVDEGPLPACRAALQMHDLFRRVRRQPNHPLSDFFIGIGIAHGNAIAGKIGAQAVAKVGVFGPVVNLASRLEGLTKILKVPMLVDEVTARMVRENADEMNGARCRQMATIAPYGMKTSVQLSQLLPPAGDDDILTDDQIVLYEAALTLFNQGDWRRSRELLEEMPAWDGGRKFLLKTMGHREDPPDSWQGVIAMTSK